MRYYSTRNSAEGVSFAAAALRGLAPDGGLYVPQEIPQYPGAVKRSLGAMSLPEIAFETLRPYVEEDIPGAILGDLVQGAYNFPAPLIPVGDRLMLELFHGPTAAFKDFGARFMARAFSFLRRGEDRPLLILTATSGDTGGAVAEGFFGVEGIDVTILYPKGRVTALQERQIAGLGGNISAIAVEGSFDDCQALVKAAFADPGLRARHALSSANSINVARLLPQAVYYAAAAGLAFSGELSLDCEATPRIRERSAAGRRKPGEAAVFSVPSGNFGNLTAGLYAWKMGAPIAGFVAATNVNRTVPDYLEKGVYEARPSLATISNAMDVGAPSNFERMSALLSLEEMRRILRGVWVDDDATRETIRRVWEEHGYILDPHGAVGWRAAEILAPPLAVLGTAHPAKFPETVSQIAGEVALPPALEHTMEREVRSLTMPVSLEALIGVLG
jgi:threonine synthase